MYKIPPQKPEATQLRDAFLRLLRNKRNEAGYFRARTRLAWRKLFGDYIAGETRDFMVRKGRLYVYVNSAPIRDQLNMIRDKIKDRLNEEFGEAYLEEVIVR